MLADAGSDQKSTLGPSVPVGLAIPAIGVQCALVPTAQGLEHALDGPAAWRSDSPAPGEPGLSVLAGHIDRLRLLRPGDELVIRRADGSEVRFTVTQVGLYPEGAFPAESAGAPRDHAELALITHGSYSGNLVVFARG